MMRASLIAVVLSNVSAAVCAQPANEGAKELEICFQSAHAADAICSDSKHGAAERLDCFQKARISQLECLEHISRGTAAGSAPPEKRAGTGSTELPAATVLPDKPTAAVSPEPPARAVDASSKPPDPNWIVSQTTSPIDYTPLIAVAIRLPFSVKHAPTTLAMRCRGGRTEFLVRTEGTWRASRAREVQVDYQINDQPVVRLLWTMSADGRTAIYKDDPVALLQSLPEGARLKINVLDEPGASHEAAFDLAGLDAVRDKIAAACKWPPPANKMSPEKH
jgi:hypothetical protein